MRKICLTDKSFSAFSQIPHSLFGEEGEKGGEGKVIHDALPPL